MIKKWDRVLAGHPLFGCFLIADHHPHKSHGAWLVKSHGRESVGVFVCSAVPVRYGYLCALRDQGVVKSLSLASTLVLLYFGGVVCTIRTGPA